MTTDEINRAIGELYGWSADYCGDLNAMHEVEMTLGKRLSAYGELLRDMTPSSREEHPSCYLWNASARTRAEAFLRVMGKWPTNGDHLHGTTKMVGEVQP